MKEKNTQEQLIEELRQQLNEANETINAIRTGQVDALVVEDAGKHQLFTLKTADQTYRVFIEKMTEGAVTLSMDGTVLYSNSSFANTIQSPLSEVIGADFNAFVDENSKALFKSLFQQGWKKDVKSELFLITNTGAVLPILVSMTTLDLDEGTALSVITTDLSVQKNTEKQLQQKNDELLHAQEALEVLNDELELRVSDRTKELFLSREHFRFLADNLPVMVWTATPNGNVDYFNKKWYQYTGLDKTKSLEWGWQTVLHPEDSVATITKWSESLKTGEEYSVEYRFLRASDSTYRWHLGTGVPFRDEKGLITQWFGVCVDIEDQKAAMTKKDEFISMASHELKTPLTIIKAFTQILSTTFNNNPIASGFVSRMEQQVNKLNNLITDLLDATKVNAGEMLFDKIFFNFNDMVQETAGQIQLTSATHLIELKLAGTIQVSGDKNRLSQVVSNLISNAIKYSPDANKIVVTSGLSNNNIRLCIQDFGIGIPLNEQSKLFNRFFRANEAKTNTFPGLGLGLYISSEIMKRHSGSLSFKSLEGEGSTFCMRLPVVH